ncbi:hypothetical protein BTVI_63720 [Pitangus sulphuratus]|nr:hypothetical protein BTVI_63720 [Pitangus sulphuratus]
MGYPSLLNAMVMMLSDASMRHKNIPPAQPLYQQQSFWKTSWSKQGNFVCREGTFMATAVGPVSLWVTLPGCCRCCRECITITFVLCPFKDTVEKVMTKGIDAQILRCNYVAVRSVTKSDGIFGVFVRLEDVIDCTLTKFAIDAKLSVEVNTSYGRATLQENLDRLEYWSNNYIMKFSKDKCLKRYMERCAHGNLARIATVQAFHKMTAEELQSFSLSPASLPVSFLTVSVMDWRVEAGSLIGCPKGWDAAGLLVADIARSPQLSPATWRVDIIHTEDVELLTGGTDVSWDPPAPPLVAHGEIAEEYPDEGDKSLHALLEQDEGHFQFHQFSGEEGYGMI